MGFKSRNIFGAQLNRNFKAGSKIADNVTKGLLLGGLVGADYIYRKSKQPRSQYRPLTKGELQELEKWELQHAKPFSFTKTIILHSIFNILVFVAPLLGIFLYSYDWWMFFCVLTSGFLEFVLDWPAILLPDNIRSDWKFDKNNEQKQKKQIKNILHIFLCFIARLGSWICCKYLCSSSQLIRDSWKSSNIKFCGCCNWRNRCRCC